jgi:diguanylate cyclase (GGDEF)-like protein/PAS domain S-box-containing protein
MLSHEHGQLDVDAYLHGIVRARLGVWDWNLVTGECGYSASWFDMLGYAPGELEQASDLWLELTHPDDRARAIESGERHLRGETAEIETEIRLRRKDGTWLWVLDRGGIVERDADGRPTRMVGVQADISRQKEAELALQQTNERFRLALEASDVGIWEFDPVSQTSFWDSRTREIFGVDPDVETHKLQSWQHYLHPEDREMAERQHEAVGINTDIIRYRIIREDGKIRHVETFARMVQTPSMTKRLTGTIRDVTEDVERRAALKWAAEHDGLTGLLTRSTFEHRLAKHLEDPESPPCALLYIDIDHFKSINDSGGHDAGDAALRQIADVLRWTAGNGHAARLGGDEFAILADINEELAGMLAGKIIDAVRGLSTDAGGAVLSASIGIAVAWQGEGVRSILKRADQACYAAKRGGRGRWVIDDIELEARASSAL